MSCEGDFYQASGSLKRSYLRRIVFTGLESW